MGLLVLIPSSLSLPPSLFPIYIPHLFPPHLFSPIPSPHPAMTEGKGARKHLRKNSTEDKLTFPPPLHHKTFLMGGRGCYKISAGRMNNPIKKKFWGGGDKNTHFGNNLPKINLICKTDFKYFFIV